MEFDNYDRSKFDRSWYSLTYITEADKESWNRVERADREWEILDFLDHWQERGGIVILPDDAAFQELLETYRAAYVSELFRPADELVCEACQRCNVI